MCMFVFNNLCLYDNNNNTKKTEYIYIYIWTDEWYNTIELEYYRKIYMMVPNGDFYDFFLFLVLVWKENKDWRVKKKNWKIGR